MPLARSQSRPSQARHGAAGMKPLDWTEWQDAIIRKIYGTQSYAQRRRALKQHLPKLAPRDRQQVYQRALQIGVVEPVKRQGPWTAAEIDIVEQNAQYRDATIAKKLQNAGFKRTVAAVHVYRNRYVTGIRQGRIDAGIYTANQVGAILGAASKTVCYWIHRGWLKATRGDQRGPHEVFQIHAKDLRHFIIHHIGYCDLSRCDKYALIDILCPEHGAKDAVKDVA
jgi:hypothetical protein